MMSTVVVALDPETEEEEEAELNKSAELAEEGLLRALTLPELLTTPRVDPVVALQEVEIPAVETPSIAPPPAWPCPLELEVELLQQQGSAAWPDLSAARSNEEVEMWIRQHGKITVRAVTWNLAGKQPPAGEALARQLVPPDRYHLYVIGTEECERSIAASALNPSKKNWEDYLGAVLGPRYIPLRSHTLQAIHLIVFAHIALAPMCKDITSAAVATGVANTLGNKGGLAVSLCIGSTKFVIVNAHLAAHQNAVKRRNSEFQKLRKELPLLLAKRERSAVTATAASDQSGPLLENCADRVIFMGDLNYRIRGNRSVVDKLLQTGMHDVMLANDQLKWSIGSGFVFEHFTEPPLNFRPTYKFDFESDEYDTGSKQRIPAWADRILFVERGLECVAYNADFSVKTSDHRPVYATFIAQVVVDAPAPLASTPAFSSESQVCSIS